MENEARKKKKKGSPVGFVLRLIVFVIALGVFAFSAYKLYTIFHGYYAAQSEYDDLQSDFTKSGDEIETDDLIEADVLIDPREKMMKPPFEVDFDELHKVNEEIVGWIYVEGIPTINYPILHTKDNDFYLHRTFRKEDLFPGSIFVDYKNKGTFEEPNTIVYGHNMKNGSMFGQLKNFKDQEFYDANPYFWIYTPEGAYRYKIYSVHDTSEVSEAYTIFSGGGKKFLEWQEKMKKNSVVTTNIVLSEDDRTVLLSTCTSNSTMRTVVIGRRVLAWPAGTYRIVNKPEGASES